MERLEVYCIGEFLRLCCSEKLRISIICDNRLTPCSQSCPLWLAAAPPHETRPCHSRGERSVVDSTMTLNSVHSEVACIISTHINCL